MLITILLLVIIVVFLFFCHTRKDFFNFNMVEKSPCNYLGNQGYGYEVEGLCEEYNKNCNDSSTSSKIFEFTSQYSPDYKKNKQVWLSYLNSKCSRQIKCGDYNNDVCPSSEMYCNSQYFCQY